METIEIDKTTRKRTKLLAKKNPESFNFNNGVELKIVGGLDYVVEKINTRFMEHYGVPFNYKLNV